MVAAIVVMAFASFWVRLMSPRAAPPQGEKDAEWFARQRKAAIERQVMGIGITDPRYDPIRVTDPRVIQAMMAVPREEFCLPEYRELAYTDQPLPIGSGQTISAINIVGLMTAKLQPQPDDKVLEIGTGSGYQAAVLAQLVKMVYTIEIVPELAKRAEETLQRLGYKNVVVKAGDGYKGWPEHAPFDSIIVTCAPDHVPQPLVDQLREGGRMVIPVGERYDQQLVLLTKTKGKVVRQAIIPVLFVPMTGEAERKR
jgi:protein-L-isoaspartate(D-aspartate) O-methyltransferase